MEKAVDKTRIGKEVNMAIAEILKGRGVDDPVSFR